jgi:hypothetical protein
MLGDRLGDEHGRTTCRRVPPSDTGPKVETSFEAAGTLIGKDVQDLGTYWSELRADGTCTARVRV